MDRRNFCKAFSAGAAGLSASPTFAVEHSPAGRRTGSPASGLQRLKYGFFVHFVWAGKTSLTARRDGEKVKSFAELVTGFDVDSFARDIAAWGVEYVVFTAWHAGINPLFPSATMKKWGLDSHYCERDLIGEVITALRKHGVGVLLYTHPRDGHDLNGDDQLKTGWNRTIGTNPDWDVFDYDRWNNFTNELYAELIDRYGKDIIGLYLDEGSGAGDSWRVVDYQRLRKNIMSKYDHLIMVQNYYGNLYSNDIGDMEYHHWREFESHDGKMWPASTKPVASCFATTWWADKAQGTNTVVFSAEDMFRYTLLQAGTNIDGGGTQWAAGPYANGGWETGVDETMRKLAGFIAPIAKSIKGTVASRAFPTRDGMTLGSTAWGAPVVEWGVATDAPDGTETYIHVLRPPQGQRLRIGMPANRARFASAELLVSGLGVKLISDAAGYALELPAGASFDPLNTTICLKRQRR